MTSTRGHRGLCAAGAVGFVPGFLGGACWSGLVGRGHGVSLWRRRSKAKIGQRPGRNPGGDDLILLDPFDFSQLLQLRFNQGTGLLADVKACRGCDQVSQIGIEEIFLDVVQALHSIDPPLDFLGGVSCLLSQRLETFDGGLKHNHVVGSLLLFK